ncbi:DNA polymerase beta superfamily protein [Haloferula chungangensis]|uniref:DNA polymerase beta superfamily protein n=1 Tax=Haloferula chungangensis TaxID=1048331 RepID=A0ABW2L7R9_9BACT
MTERIQTLLRDLEAKHGIEILYACESGSRAWGFASPDSDYDIRFLYRRPMLDAFTISEGSDTIEIPIEDDLDPGGWDIRKALGLLQKSNGALIEWLHSPIVYHANPEFLTDLRNLAAEHLSRKGLANHYRGLAGQFYRNKLTADMPSAKGYLYCLRALLAARFVLEHGKPPPVPFAELIPTAPDDVAEAIDELVAWKADASENQSPGRQVKLDKFIEAKLPGIGAEMDALPGDPTSRAPFNEVLHRWSLWPKSTDTKPVYKSEFTLERVRRSDRLLFEAVSGSRSFGTHHERSDFDLRGIFVAPPSFLGGLESIDQVSDEKSDEVYYEIGRFVSLLLANNPNIIELLFTPKDCIRHRHAAFDLLKPEDFLSKLCRQTFGNYAMSQIRKARGLNKKIVNPQPEQRHPLRHFCHILRGQGSVRLDEWLATEGLDENQLGLVSAPHATNTYAVFHDKAMPTEMRGIFSHKDEGAIVCSSVEKEAEPIAWLTCNLDAFKAHCKAHREYWQWVELRNEERFETNTAHNRGYDSKNLMHTLRLLDQAIEIAKDHHITLPRPNSDWLKRIKSGEFSYDELLRIAEEKHAEMEAAFEASSLPDSPSRERATEILLEIRQQFLTA